MHFKASLLGILQETAIDCAAGVVAVSCQGPVELGCAVLSLIKCTVYANTTFSQGCTSLRLHVAVATKILYVGTLIFVDHQSGALPHVNLASKNFEVASRLF
jgi:hypothetical protein